MNKIKGLYGKLMLLMSLLMFNAVAFAAAGAAVDVTDVTGTINNQPVSVEAVGGAVLMLIVVIKAFKWIRRAL